MDERQRCGAKTRAGTPCRKFPTRSNGKRCYMHGGAVGSGRPPIHGRYSKVLRAALREKLASALADGDYQNIAEELCLQRVLLAQHLEGLQGRTLTVEDTDRLLSWLTRITMTAERASRIESRTALTIAEVRLLEAGFYGGVINVDINLALIKDERFVEKRRNEVNELKIKIDGISEKIMGKMVF